MRFRLSGTFHLLTQLIIFSHVAKGYWHIVWSVGVLVLFLHNVIKINVSLHSEKVIDQHAGVGFVIRFSSLHNSYTYSEWVQIFKNKVYILKKTIVSVVQVVLTCCATSFPRSTTIVQLPEQRHDEALQYVTIVVKIKQNTEIQIINRS